MAFGWRKDRQGHAVDTTDMSNEEFRTFAAVKSVSYKNGCKAYNDLSPMPTEEIELPDGRVLRILEWQTKASMEHTMEGGMVELTMLAWIARPESKDKGNS